MNTTVNNMPSEEKKANLRRWLPMTAIIFFINVLLFGSLYMGFDRSYRGKVYPGVYLGQTALGGKTETEIQALIKQKIDKIMNDGIVFAYDQDTTTLLPINVSLNADVAYEVMAFDKNGAVEDAINYGRGGNLIADLFDKLKLLVVGHQVKQPYTIDEEKIGRILKDNFKHLEKPAQNADLIYHKPSGSRWAEKQFSVVPESVGKTIDYAQGIQVLKNNLQSLDNSPVKLVASSSYPLVLAKDCLNVEKQAEDKLSLAPLTLVGAAKKWVADKNQLALWLHLEMNPEATSSASSSEKVIVTFNPAAVKQYLSETVAITVDKKPLDAKFAVVKGKITKFQSAEDGLELDLDATYQSINEQFFHGTSSQVALVTKVVKGIENTDEVNDLGLKEIIGTGESNFSGSPTNRRHNIKVGADAVNGTLIAPDEEFSLLKTLGEISSSTGYLPELVIKQNKTTPEFGGGLCQIGTTVFRASLASGMPITQRRNHSYRVSYYEPAGTDATIYDPWPDFRFINDTGNYILIQSRINGDNLYFYFWGTKDGRVVDKTAPTIYNIVKPAPAKIIETLDLKPGEKKCTEKAHNGADAYFDYKVTYSSGDVKEKRFTSHYVPWQEVCLLGVKELSATGTPLSLDGSNTTAATSTVR